MAMLRAPNEYFWSGEMLKASLQKMLTVTEFEECQKVIKFDNLIPLDRLRELLSPISAIIKHPFDTLLQELIVIRHYEYLPTFLGLVGCSNNELDITFTPTNQLGHSLNSGENRCATRNVLFQKIAFTFTESLFQYNYDALKKCVLLVGTFYADKFSMKLGNDVFFSMNKKLFDNLVIETCQGMATLVNRNESFKEAIQTMSNMHIDILREALFEFSNHYLMPEFNYELNKARESEKRHDLFFSQTLGRFSVIFEKSFEMLENNPFCKPEGKGFQLLPGSTRCLRFYNFAKHFAFTMEANTCLQEYHSKSKTLPFSNDPLAMIDMETFDEFCKSEELTASLPIFVGFTSKYRNGFYLPILSPSGQLCLPACSAMIQWLEWLDTDATFLLHSKNLDNFKKYVEKSVKFFTTEKKNYLFAVDFKNFDGLIKEGKKLYANEMKKLKESGIDVHEPVTELPAELCSVLPNLPYFHKASKAAFYNHTPVFLAFLSAYPELARFVHEQKICHLSDALPGQRACYLGVLNDEYTPEIEKCVPKVSAKFYENYRKLFNYQLNLSKNREETVKESSKSEFKKTDKLDIEKPDLEKEVKKLKAKEKEQSKMNDNYRAQIKTLEDGKARSIVQEDEWKRKEIKYQEKIRKLTEVINNSTDNNESKAQVGDMEKPRKEMNDDKEPWADEKRKLQEMHKQEIKQLKDTTVSLVQAKEWKAEKEEYKKRNNEYLKKLDDMAANIEKKDAQLKVMKGKEQEYQKERERSKMEMKQIREQLKQVEGWREKEEEYQKTEVSNKAEIQKLNGKLRECKSKLDNHTKLQKAKDLKYQKEMEKQKAENKKLSDETSKLKKEREGWKETEARYIRLAGKTQMDVKVDEKCVELNGKALVKYFEKYEQELRSQKESAKMELQEFQRHSINDMDVKLAKKEFRCYEIDTEGMLKKVAENLKILKNNPSTPPQLLYDVVKLKATVFSFITIDKIKQARKEKLEEENRPECCICAEELSDGQRMFKCRQCANECHYSCYAEWAKREKTCPLCRQVNPNTDEYPALV